MDDFTREQFRRLLLLEMSDISEECWYAGWLTGLEHLLWNAIQTPEKPYNFGLSEIEPERLCRLRELSDRLGEWGVFDMDLGTEACVPIPEYLKIRRKEYGK